MILDSIDNIHRYDLPQKKAGKLMDFLKSFNISDFQKGRFDIDGNHLFGIGLEYETQKEEEGLWEAHRKYIDVHVILEGEEKIYFSDIEKMTETKVYDKEGDYALFEGERMGEVTLKKNDVLFLYPNEVHKTSLMVEGESSRIRKYVLKLEYSHLLE